jgi:FtsP/CotA-like multicopper oxidase with cupredoxin domain
MNSKDTTSSLQRLVRFLSVAGVGLVSILAGLVWDASLHSRDHGLAAREGVLTLTDPAHALFALGVFLTAVGVAGAVTALIQALTAAPWGGTATTATTATGARRLQGLRTSLRTGRTRAFAVGVAVGVGFAAVVPAALSAVRSSGGSGHAGVSGADVLHAAPAASGHSVGAASARGAPMGTVQGGYGDGTFPADYSLEGGVKVFHLRAAPTDWEVEPGVVKKAYAFNGMIPGPVIQVNEGDRVRMVVTNALTEATSIHWHGMILPNDQDGVPGLTQSSIAPGQTYTYEFTAQAAGTHWYHTHMGGREIGRGLYGALEVVPRLGDFRADRDYHLFLGDTDLGFVINGRTFPATIPLQSKVGERIHLRLFDAGDQSHPVHLHGFPFQVMAQDGIPLTYPQKMDTLLISPGQTFDVLIVPQTPGRWLLHCHIFSHSEGDDGMTGLVTTLDVADSKAPAPPLPNLPLPNIPGLPMLNQGAGSPSGSVRPDAPAAKPNAAPNQANPAAILPPIDELLRKLTFGNLMSSGAGGATVRPQASRLGGPSG